MLRHGVRLFVGHCKSNWQLEKHGVSFDEVVSAFDDPLSVTIADPKHSLGEGRFILTGLASTARLLVVARVERGDNIRIINARLATCRERLVYEEGTQARKTKETCRLLGR
jgi:uncharacterized protein